MTLIEAFESECRFRFVREDGFCFPYITASECMQNYLKGLDIKSVWSPAQWTLHPEDLARKQFEHKLERICG